MRQRVGYYARNLWYLEVVTRPILLTSRILSNQAVANTWWDPFSLPSCLTKECYVQKVQPLLSAKKVREIAAAIQVSELYAGFIRSGRRRPHPRHWQALAALVGVVVSNESR